LGEEDSLEHKHIGHIAYIDVHVRSVSRVIGGVTEEYAWHLHVHVGRIVGFIEHRGKITLDRNERPDDSSDYPDYVVTILLEDGRKIPVGEMDRCSIWVPDLDVRDAA